MKRHGSLFIKKISLCLYASSAAILPPRMGGFMPAEWMLWDLDHLKEAYTMFDLTESNSYLLFPLGRFDLQSLH